MKVLRVFVRRTSYTPTDELAFVGPPPFKELIPKHDEVHVSCIFTWDMDEAEDLAYQWEGATNKPVKLGGPAYHSPCEDFVPGLYVRKGIIFTSRGCNNNCPWCGVREMEGKLRELPISPGKYGWPVPCRTHSYTGPLSEREPSTRRSGGLLKDYGRDRR